MTAAPTPPSPPANREGALSLAVNGLFALACLYTLYFARDFLILIFLAAFLSLLLLPFVRFMKRRWRCSEPFSAGLFMAAALCFCIASVFYVAQPARDWLQAAPTGLQNLEYRLNAFKKPIQKVAEASAQVEKLADVTPGPNKQPQVAPPPFSPLKQLLVQTPLLAASLLTILVLAYFILASGDSILRSLVGSLPGYRGKKKAVSIARTVEGQITSYLQTITGINICLGLIMAVAAYLMGLKNYILWGVVGGLLNYIPYVGALAGVLIYFLVSFMSFAPLSQAFTLPALYFVCTTAEGYFITPSLLGRFMTLNPLAVFLSLLFWGWIWGVVGVFLAVPLLAIMKILCEQIAPLRPFCAFLAK